MTIATGKLEIASQRFMLIRMTPARYVGSSLASAGGGVYTMTFPYPVSSMERNGTALTLVTSLVSNNQYTYDETTQLLSVKLASAPDVSTNVLVVFYNLFYTGGQWRYTYETPTDSSTTVRAWEPRVESYPVVTQGFKNIISGVFSIEDTSFTLNNVDFGFQKYLTDNDSFYQKDVSIWMCIGDESTLQKIYQGKVNDLQVGSDAVVVTAYDAFSRLNQPCLMGDTTEEAYYQRGSSFPSLDPSKHNTPIPYIMGKASKHVIKLPTDLAYIDTSTTNHAVCISFDAVNILTTTNRVWGLCRISSAGLKTQTFGTTPTWSGGVSHVITFSVTAGDNLESGDTFYITNGGTKYPVFLYSKEVTGLNRWEGFCPYNTTSPGAGTLTLNSDPIVFVNALPCTPGVHYNTTYVTTSGGNKFIKITFVDNFEALIGLGHTLDPSTDSVTYVVRTADTSLNHADALSKIVQSVGIASVDATSFAAAKAALTSNVWTQIPSDESSDYSSTRELIESILGSTLGYLKMNPTTGKAEYYLLNAAPSSTNTVDKDLIIDGALSIRVDYNDIVTKLLAYNPYVSGQIYTDLSSATPFSVAESAKAKYLHTIYKSEIFPHVLDSIDSRLPTILALRSARRTTYDFDTATFLVDAIVGDDVTIRGKGVLGANGTETSIATKIVSLRISVDGITAEGCDLLGLT